MITNLATVDFINRGRTSAGEHCFGTLSICDHGTITPVCWGLHFEEDGSGALQGKLPGSHGRSSGQARDRRDHETREAGCETRSTAAHYGIMSREERIAQGP